MRLHVSAVLWVASCLMGCRAPGSTTPLLETPAWGRPGALLLRGNADGTALLLRQVGGSAYRYLPAAKSLSPITPAQWDHGTAVAECERQLPVAALPPHPADGGRRVLAGPELVTTRLAPGGRRVAVVSAAARGASVMSFVAQGHRGPFHHEVLSWPAGAPEGVALRLPFTSTTSAVSVCWSADERFVVFTDLFMSSVVVVEVSAAR